MRSSNLGVMAKSTTEILKRLRHLMKDTSVVTETIKAYIVPSGDAHQVIS